MNAKQYAAYVAAVEHNTKGLEHLSIGACAKCSECDLGDNPTSEQIDIASSGGFSWSACDCCGREGGGTLVPAHGIDKDGEIIHLEACENCGYFLTFGELDDQTMDEVRDSKQDPDSKT